MPTGVNLDVSNPIYITFALLHIVHGQAICFRCFIFVTNDEIEWSSVISIGNEFQITEPKYLKEFLLVRTVFTEGITSSGLDRKLMVLFLFTRIFLNCSQKYEEPCKFQLRVSGYFDGEYRRICPLQVIDQIWDNSKGSLI